MLAADPTISLSPGQPYIVDGNDWSWAFVIFRDVPGFPGYCVGSDGSTWTRRERFRGRTGRLVPTCRPLKQTPNRQGYLVVSFQDGPRRVQRFAHQLVLEAFIGPKPPGQQCCHHDGDKTNNRIGNLRWDTAKANHADRIRHGRTPRGEKHPDARFTADQVREIRRRYANGEARCVDMAREFGVTWGAIKAIVARRAWAHVA